MEQNQHHRQGRYRILPALFGIVVTVSSTLVLTLALTLVLTLVFSHNAEAIPAFARKYNVSCNVCHTRQPRLNSFGQSFMENGYQLPGTEDGGITKKRLLGGAQHGITLDDMSNLFAIRLRADIQKADFRNNSDTESTDDIDIIFPNILNLFFAGTVARNISVFMEAEYATQGEEEAKVEFERAFIIFDNLGGHQIANVKIGVFDPSSFFAFPTHRQTINNIATAAHTDEFPAVVNRIPLLPLAFASKMYGLSTGQGNAGATATDPDTLKDDFAILPFKPYLYNAASQTGISVHGRPFGPKLLYQIGVAQNQTAEDTPQTRWDPYLMLSYDVMQGDYSALQIAGFYYHAPKAAMPVLNPAGTLIYADDTVDWTRVGLGLRWQHKALDVYGTIIRDSIDTPRFSASSPSQSVWDTDALGISIAADYLLTSRWLLGVRYDTMEPGGLEKLPPAQQGSDPAINQPATFIGIIGKYFPTPNIGLYARAHYNLEGAEQLPTNVFGGKQHPARNLKSMVSVGVDMAF